jgi:hypothetical protein
MGHEKVVVNAISGLDGTVVELWRGPLAGFAYGYFGGGERTRTADFYVANVALYQLSYTPGKVRSYPSG